MWLLFFGFNSISLHFTYELLTQEIQICKHLSTFTEIKVVQRITIGLHWKILSKYNIICSTRRDCQRLVTVYFFDWKKNTAWDLGWTWVLFLHIFLFFSEKLIKLCNFSIKKTENVLPPPKKHHIIIRTFILFFNIWINVFKINQKIKKLKNKDFCLDA